MVKNMDSEVPLWVQISVPLFISWVTADSLFKLSEPQCPYL